MVGVRRVRGRVRWFWPRVRARAARSPRAVVRSKRTAGPPCLDWR